ncbi:MAG: hypothetical protein E7552_02625 [Ruminococcaceae bacterium]|nr:hypothetical protein [Oscillospiraceae bacterium]
MADYVYATSSGKTYDELIKESQARSSLTAAQYAEKANAANENYKTSINGMFDSRIKVQEEAAAAEAGRVHASYRTQFDANAASELARERRLKEKMAALGLTQSGYNATNQTAAAVARSNADAATRTARGQAVDAVYADLREYRAEAESARAEALAKGDYETAQRIAEVENSLLANAHKEAMERLEYDTSLEEFAYERERDEKELAYKMQKDAAENERMMKEYVDTHNREVYELMLKAYESGNTPLAEAYSQTLWQMDESGTVVPMVMDVSAASAYTARQNALEEQARSSKNSTANKTKTGYDELGFARKYSDQIQEARKLVMDAAQSAYNHVREEMTNRALNLMYLVEQHTKEVGSEGYMDEATFKNLLRYVGFTPAEYNGYVNSIKRAPVLLLPNGTDTKSGTSAAKGR